MEEVLVTCDMSSSERQRTLGKQVIKLYKKLCPGNSTPSVYLDEDGDLEIGLFNEKCHSMIFFNDDSVCFSSNYNNFVGQELKFDSYANYEEVVIEIAKRAAREYSLCSAFMMCDKSHSTYQRTSQTCTETIYRDIS